MYASMGYIFHTIPDAKELGVISARSVPGPPCVMQQEVTAAATWLGCSGGKDAEVMAFLPPLLLCAAAYQEVFVSSRLDGRAVRSHVTLEANESRRRKNKYIIASFHTKDARNSISSISLQ